MIFQRKHKKHSPHYLAFAAVSIDGRISLDSAALPDWTSKEDWNFFQGMLKKADAIVAGRTTYEVVRERLDRRTTYVLSSGVTSPVVNGSVTTVNPKHADLRTMLSGYGVVAIVGGAEAYQTMLDLGLLDELYLTVEPIIFGRGRELFKGGEKNVDCKLLSSKKLNSRGTMLLRYEIVK